MAGLLIYEARRIPEVGESFQFHGFRFEVVRRQRHQLTLLRIRPPTTPDGSGLTVAAATTVAERARRRKKLRSRVERSPGSRFVGVEQSIVPRSD